MFQPLARTERAGGLQNLKAGQTGGGPELISGKAVAVKEGLELAVFAEEGVEHGLRCEGRRHRQVATRQPFCQRHEIRLHPFVLAGK